MALALACMAATGFVPPCAALARPAGAARARLGLSGGHGLSLEGPLPARDGGVRQLQEQLAAVRAIKLREATRRREDFVRKGFTNVVSGRFSKEPTFTKLFTHETWDSYTGRPPLARWWCVVTSWRSSTVLANVAPVCVLLGLLAALVTSLPASILPRVSPLPMSLQGTAIGLLLVFRTNNSYLRLSEARELWGRAIVLCREIAQSVTIGSVPAASPPADAAAPQQVAPQAVSQEVPQRWQRPAAGPPPTSAGSAAEHPAAAAGISTAALRTCGYLVAFGWELSAKLSSPLPRPGPQTDKSEDVLCALLPAAEAEWTAAQRSRPLALLQSMRRCLHADYTAGRLPAPLYYKLEEDIRELDFVVGSCERLFSSPLPPTMTRHLVRCLLLWLAALPACLAGASKPPRGLELPIPRLAPPARPPAEHEAGWPRPPAQCHRSRSARGSPSPRTSSSASRTWARRSSSPSRSCRWPRSPGSYSSMSRRRSRSRPRPSSGASGDARAA